MLKRFAYVTLILLCAAPARPDEAPASAAQQTAPKTWGFTGRLGTGGVGGDYGHLFTKPISWEFDFFRQKGSWRYGVGLGFGSFKMKEPYQDELEWGFLQTSLGNAKP